MVRRKGLLGAPHLHFVNLRPVFCTIIYFPEFIKSDTMTILKLQDIRHCNYYSHFLGTKPFSWHAALHEWSQRLMKLLIQHIVLTSHAKCARSFRN